MPDTLRAGSIDSKDDSPLYYADSMARAMEKAFLEEWPKVMGEANIPVMDKQMSLMFVAIAKGVINHLHDNSDAFIVAEDATGSPIPLKRINRDL